MCTEPDMYSMPTLADLIMKQFKITEYVSFKIATIKLGSNASLTSLEKAMIRNSCNRNKNSTLKTKLGIHQTAIGTYTKHKQLWSTQLPDTCIRTLNAPTSQNASPKHKQNVFYWK